MNEIRETATCGCCQSSLPPTPQDNRNRLGLSAIRRRVGTYSTFLQSMAGEIQGKIELGRWTTRPGDIYGDSSIFEDHGIALLKMWAYLADILTFYQERIANESLLRTAVHPESIRRMAALLDYRPSPGLAATAELAFIVERGKQADIPKGLRVQSIPGQGESPQKFETVGPLRAIPELNQFRAYPQLIDYSPLAKGSRKAMTSKDVSYLSPGDKIAIFEEGTRSIEEKEIESIRAVGWQLEITWKPAIASAFGSGAKISKWRRKIRLFGHNVPEKTQHTMMDGSKIVVKDLISEFCLKNNQSFYLDSIYDDLGEKTICLLAAKRYNNGPIFSELITIDSVWQENAKIIGTSPDLTVAGTPVTSATVAEATVTRINSSKTVPEMDIKSAVIYELEGDLISLSNLWNKEFDSSFRGNKIFVSAEDLSPNFADAVSMLSRGKKIILKDDKGRTQMIEIYNAQPKDGVCIEIDAKDPITDSFGSASGYGNVIPANHGETIEQEVLGDGDSSSVFQSFSLRKSPVTFISDPNAPRGASNTLEIRVDGLRWKEVDSFFGHRGDERIYTKAIDERGKMTVRFGDGITAARLPTGRNNVAATYRQGLGRAGTVRAGTLTTLLDRPTGLKGVVNPSQARCGVDPESLEEARANAPNTVRTFGRIVSLRDFEDAAREFPGVSKAQATWTWDGEGQSVVLTVSSADASGGCGEVNGDLREYLDRRRDINRRLIIQSLKRVFIVIEARVWKEEGRLSEEVEKAALWALEDYFKGLNLGQSIHLSKICEAIQSANGVMAVDVNLFRYRDESDRISHGSDMAPVLTRIPIFDAHLDSLMIRPAELAELDSAILDIEVFKYERSH